MEIKGNKYKIIIPECYIELLDGKDTFKRNRTDEQSEENEQKTLMVEKPKKYVRYTEGAKRYSMSLSSFEKLSKEANAVRKINKLCLVNTEIFEQYIEEMYS